MMRGPINIRLNGEVNRSYSSSNIIRANKSSSMRLARHVARNGMMRNSYIYFSWSTTRKCYTMKNNIKMDVKDAVCEDVEELAFLRARFGGCIKGCSCLIF